ncbi:acetamidase [Luminiphilus syltensis NOR5-1B]|uniref:Acetamidase n=1 Tax=Luminiphilus syltensis NOR5-1B TaxID=565045 RepID=B8KXJ3_9GAMM|nr:acetamidase/formamidase family protein [Luminiphilus syltensis]EED35674.1 acetamidase [Luminiphilus syltensis NOR5-1B]
MRNWRLVRALLGLLPIVGGSLISHAEVVVGDGSVSCAADPACMNRLHPDIPMVATAQPGERIVFAGRDALDLALDADDADSGDVTPNAGSGIVHPLTGPVYIKGAKAGDVLAVTIESLEPAQAGWTESGAFGFAGDQFGIEERFIVWRIDSDYAVSDALPGVRIPNASFPGVLTTLPGEGLLKRILQREAQLLEAGGAVVGIDPTEAQPASMCGAEGTKAAECLRTIHPVSTAAIWIFAI